MNYSEFVGIGNDNLETGGAVEAVGKELILHGMSRLIRTPPRAYPLDERIGNAAWQYVHLPMSEAVTGLLTVSSLEALQRWEPRVELDTESAENAVVDPDNGSVFVRIPYRFFDEPFSELVVQLINREPPIGGI